MWVCKWQGYHLWRLFWVLNILIWESSTQGWIICWSRRVSEEYKTSAAILGLTCSCLMHYLCALVHSCTQLGMTWPALVSCIISVHLSTVVLSWGWWCSKRAQRHRTETVCMSQGRHPCPPCLLPHISLLHSLSLTPPSPGQVLINAWHSIHCWEAKKPHWN